MFNATVVMRSMKTLKQTFLILSLFAFSALIADDSTSNTDSTNSTANESTPSFEVESVSWTYPFDEDEILPGFYFGDTATTVISTCNNTRVRLVSLAGEPWEDDKGYRCDSDVVTLAAE